VNPKLKVVIYGIILFIIAVGIIYAALKFIDTSSNLDGIDDNKSSLNVLRKEVDQDIKEFKMIKRLNTRNTAFKKEDFDQISDYQKYVTPDNTIVQSYTTSNTIDSAINAYSTAVDWIWVSDLTLHKKIEHWLLPAEFITNTPTDPDNPIPGNMVSDCESHAYTLVSLLEILGISKANVRVVIGEVEFEGETGGHAWVQVYENGEWFELDATSGPYWDDDENVLVNNNGFTYSFFKTRPYPVNEYWAFFNDRYYYNPDTGLKSPDLPLHWLRTD
jgi:hypothetical protein